MSWVESESNATPLAGSSRQPWATMAERVQDADGSHELFEEIRVWRKLDAHRMWLYRCLKNRQSGHYAVQGRERVYTPEGGGRVAHLAHHFVTLAGHTSASEHCSWHDTLEAAIEANDAAHA
ncbi:MULTISPECIES: hypothetical protein [Dyella]|uniref:Uncharacterized protein n=2 Tax=Dyella TaxID=231454 RepID=A0A4R0YRG5_9GAMM|nr:MULTISPECIES: hypothetical protein [Dyella]TBR36445.1 hypothetical protein EYV96_10895 [Dyella terrae]TCI08463.1 hypothetical protein EZM97_27975 [Dyella soli]